MASACDFLEDLRGLECLSKDQEEKMATIVFQENEDENISDRKELSGNSGLPKLLISSPYVTKPHILDLGTLGPMPRYLAVALAELRPLFPTYALRPFSLALNWEEIFTIRLPALIASHGSGFDTIWPVEETQLFYVVFFRSTLHEDIDVDLLSRLDEESHAEATSSGGLLKYWFGKPDAQRRNLATCVWRSREDATEGGKGPWHRRARLAASELYKAIEFRKLWLRLRRDTHGHVDWNFVDSSVYDPTEAR